MKKNPAFNLKKFISMTALLLVMTFSIFNTMAELCFNYDVENIELSKLADGESENEKENSEKDIDDKIKYNSLAALRMENDFKTHSQKASYINSAHTQEIITPPPEFV